MRRLSTLLVSIALISSHGSGFAQARFGESLCQRPEYTCIRIQPGEDWESLFPEAEEQDIVRRVNRMNINLHTGMHIAVPKHLERLTIYDVAPFPRYIDSPGEKIIFANQKQLAWAAYSAEGELVWWGPLSSGKGEYQTPSGLFRIIRKQDVECISTAFPQRPDGESGGAEMPYCMHFFRGYALHGSEELPGFRASHGCIRLFPEDARWLNEEFIDLPNGNFPGTRVIIDAPDDE